MDLIAYMKTANEIKEDQDNEGSKDFFNNCLFHGYMPKQDQISALEDEES